MELQLLMTRCIYLAEITMDVTLMIFRYVNYFEVGIYVHGRIIWLYAFYYYGRMELFGYLLLSYMYVCV